MPSQIEILKENIAELEAKNGPESRAVVLFRAQLSSMERSARQRETGVYEPSPMEFRVGIRKKKS